MPTYIFVSWQSRFGTNTQYLGRPHKLKMKRGYLSKGIYQVHRLLSLNLARNSGNDILNVAHYLKYLEVGMPLLCYSRFRKHKTSNILHDLRRHI